MIRESADGRRTRLFEPGQNNASNVQICTQGFAVLLGCVLGVMKRRDVYTHTVYALSKQ